jgi:hypothetical protein
MKKRGPGDKDGASDHKGALAELMALRDALNSTRDPKELDRILSRFIGIASAIPPELMPQELTVDAITTIYVNSLTRVDDSNQQTVEQNSKEDEKHAKDSFEEAVKEFDDLNKELDEFWKRKDVQAVERDLKALRRDPNSVDKKPLAQKLKQELPYKQAIAQKLSGSYGKLSKSYKKDRKAIVESCGGNEKDQAVVKFDQAYKERKSKITAQAAQLHQSANNVLEAVEDNPELRKAVGEDTVKKYEAIVKNASDLFDEVDKPFQEDRPHEVGQSPIKVADLLTGGEVQKSSGISSPDATPNNSKSQSQGIQKQ